MAKFIDREGGWSGSARVEARSSRFSNSGTNVTDRGRLSMFRASVSLFSPSLCQCALFHWIYVHMPVDACPDIPSRDIVDLKMVTLNSLTYFHRASTSGCLDQPSGRLEILHGFSKLRAIWSAAEVRLKGRYPEHTKRLGPVHSRHPCDHFVHYENTRVWIRRLARSEVECRST